MAKRNVDKYPEPNIIFVGRNEPPEIIQDGMTRIILPRAAKQKAGPFFHAEAGRICRLFPRTYKRFQKLCEV